MILDQLDIILKCFQEVSFLAKEMNLASALDVHNLVIE